jgi:Zn-dependent M28 family amino/carboxypeptidase
MTAPLRVRLAILAAILAMLVGMPGAALLWMTAVPGRSWTGPLPPLTQGEAALATRLERHVRAVASEPHNVAHPEALGRSAAYVQATLAGLGYTVARQPVDDANGIAVANLEAVIEPSRGTAATLVVGAHYDSAGAAPGANDNGTGVAALLEIARALAPLRGHAGTRVRLAFFVNEEPPFFKTERMGSLVYARRLAASGERVEAMVALETLGYYSDAPDSQHYPPPLGALYPSTGNFVAFVGTVGARPLVRRAVRDFRSKARFPSVGGTAPAFLSGIDWSDHWSFGEVGVPALMVTDTAPFRYAFYHMPGDTPDKVDYPRFARVTAGLIRVVRRWALSGR